MSGERLRNRRSEVFERELDGLRYMVTFPRLRDGRSTAWLFVVEVFNRTWKPAVSSSRLRARSSVS